MNAFLTFSRHKNEEIHLLGIKNPENVSVLSSFKLRSGQPVLCVIEKLNIIAFYLVDDEGELYQVYGDKDYLFDIDWQGTEQVKKIMPLDIVPIFILPPSINDLENRLKKREEKNKELIDQRMKMAKDEINHWKDYKYIVVNKDLENCFEQITKIVKIERELRSTFN